MNDIYPQTKTTIIAKLDSARNYIWTKILDGYCNTISGAIDEVGNIVIGGSMGSNYLKFESDSLFSNGGEDIYLLKLDSAGNQLLLMNFGLLLHIFTGTLDP